MKLKELQTLLDNQPSVSGNTYFVSAIYIISWILGIGFLILSIGLLLESAFHFKIFLDWVSRQLNFVFSQEQRWKISTSFGLVSLFLSIVFGGMIFVSKMVLTRNYFIIQLEDWLLENVKEVKLKSTKSRK